MRCYSNGTVKLQKYRSLLLLKLTAYFPGVLYFRVYFRSLFSGLSDKCEKFTVQTITTTGYKINCNLIGSQKTKYCLDRERTKFQKRVQRKTLIKSFRPQLESCQRKDTSLNTDRYKHR